MGEVPQVLLFEDDKNTREMLQTMIGDIEGIPVESYASPEECELGKGFTGVIVSDCNLENGGSWIDIVAKFPDANIYVMSGDPTDVETAQRDKRVKGSFLKTNINGILAACRASH